MQLSPLSPGCSHGWKRLSCPEHARVSYPCNCVPVWLKLTVSRPLKLPINRCIRSCMTGPKRFEVLLRIATMGYSVTDPQAQAMANQLGVATTEQQLEQQGQQQGQSSQLQNQSNTTTGTVPVSKVVHQRHSPALQRLLSELPQPEGGPILAYAKVWWRIRTRTSSPL